MAASDLTSTSKAPVHTIESRLLTALLLLLQTRAALIAGNLFLRKQLAVFPERNARPRRAKPGERMALLALARFFNWREVLVHAEFSIPTSPPTQPPNGPSSSSANAWQMTKPIGS